MASAESAAIQILGSRSAAQNAQTIGGVLEGAGLNKIGASGVIGNALQESALSPSAIGDGGGGLWGFTAPPKSLADLQAYARSRHQSWTNVKLQTDFLLQNLSKSDIAALNSQSSPQAAALWFMNNWERPLVSSENAARRVQGAEAAYTLLGGVKPIKSNTKGYSLNRPGGATSDSDTPSVDFYSDYVDLQNAQRDAPSTVYASSSSDPFAAAFDWWWNGFSSSVSNLYNDLKGPADAFGDVVDLTGETIKIIESLPWYTLRAAEFLTGIFLMYYGVRPMLQQSNPSGQSGIVHVARDLVSATPIGREMRMAQGRRMGTREGQRESARMAARQTATRGQRQASATERATIERNARSMSKTQAQRTQREGKIRYDQAKSRRRPTVRNN